MTKKTLQFVAAAAMVAGLGFGSVSTAFAATSDSASGTNTGSLHTTAKVALTAGSTSGGDNGNDGNAGDGALALVTAPNYTIDGGELGGSKALKLAGTADDSTPVQTVNPGLKTNWGVTVKSSQFATTTGTELQGAVLTLTDGSVTSPTGSTSSTAPTGEGSIELNGDGTSEKPVVTAAGNENITGDAKAVGVGTWNTNFNTASLAVPDGNTAGTYTSNLTWTLKNAPF
ncbi:WxL domain-containing protein [Levilactobacillus brevis]|uniref:WxL domain-containing protein n=1 Tax=Levilactobacillus brevis TaxID=1580 RepID=UPI000697CD93|nr:WxL domain-containing protein [Levilactobacillus brevis]